MSVIEGGATFGCNAIYRDMTVDHLICLDNQITHEIVRSGYSKETILGFVIGHLFHVYVRRYAKQHPYANITLHMMIQILSYMVQMNVQ